MNLELTDKVAVVTGADKGIGLAVTRALVAEGALVVAGRAAPGISTGSTASPRSRSTWRRPTGRRSSFSARSTSTGGVDVLVNNVGARSRPPRRFSWNERRGVRVGDADELLHRPPRHPSRADADGEARGGRDRQHRLGQRLLSARCGGTSTTEPRRPRSSTSRNRSRRSSGREASASTPSRPAR